MVKGYAKTEQVQTTLTRSWRERLDAVAERREQSRADGIRDAIENWVEEMEAVIRMDEHVEHVVGDDGATYGRTPAEPDNPAGRWELCHR